MFWVLHLAFGKNGTDKCKLIQTLQTTMSIAVQNETFRDFKISMNLGLVYVSILGTNQYDLVMGAKTVLEGCDIQHMVDFFNACLTEIDNTNVFLDVSWRFDDVIKGGRLRADNKAPWKTWENLEQVQLDADIPPQMRRRA